MARNTDMMSMSNNRNAILALVALVVSSVATPASAQYDRDGRYVPSPMGVPSDPNARVVPMYPGSPGGAVGTPTWPRDPEQKLAPLKPRVGTDDRILIAPVVPLNARRCEAGWSRSLGISRKVFESRCAKFQRDDH